MIEWIGPAVFAAFNFIGPIQRRGDSTWARHNALSVTLPFDHVTLEQGQHPEGRRAQELGENRFQALVGLVIISALVLVYPIYDTGQALALTVLTFLGGFIVKALCYSLPFIDIAGHGAEILCAEDDGLWSYREQEASRVLRDPKRRGQTLDDVLGDLDRWQWLSKFMRFLAW